MDKNNKKIDSNSINETQFEEIEEEMSVMDQGIPEHRFIIDGFEEELIDADSDADIDIESLSTEVDRITQVGKHETEGAEGVAAGPVDDSDVGIHELRGKLQDLSIKDVGNIDLREAEEIASEGVLLLTEEDLVEELEVLDLVPVESDTVPERKGDAIVPESEVSEERVAVAEQEYRADDEIPSEEMPADGILEEDSIAGSAIEESDAGEIEAGEEDGFKSDAYTISPGEEIESDDSTLVEQRDESIQERESKGIVLEEINEYLSDAPAGEEIIDEMALDSEGKELIEDDYDVGEIIDGEDFEDGADLIKDEMDEEDIYISKITESDAEDYGDSKGETEQGIHYSDVARDQESISISGEIEFDEDEVISPGSIEEKKVTSVVKEQIPSELMKLDDSDNSVYIIDDEIVKKEELDRGSESEERELEKISSDIVEAIESKAKLLEEADADKDQMVAPVMKGSEPTFEDLLIDFEEEYTYTDDELSFIDHKIVGDDYGKLEEKIYDEDERDEVKGISHAIEYLGLTEDEIDIIENNAFSKEYENIDIDAIVKKTGIGLDGAPSDFISLREYHYSIPREDSLLDSEKVSIEEDLISGSAFIFEENVEDIKGKLDKLSVKDEDGVKERIPDISNKIVIIDDESDVDRFVKSLPEDKQKNIKKLLKYLDGLFEKLPEDVVENFSKSEYFNLYMQVLDDLGI
jgi:hypothetical protein